MVSWESKCHCVTELQSQVDYTFAHGQLRSSPNRQLDGGDVCLYNGCHDTKISNFDMTLGEVFKFFTIFDAWGWGEWRKVWRKYNKLQKQSVNTINSFIFTVMTNTIIEIMSTNANSTCKTGRPFVINKGINSVSSKKYELECVFHM